jgi:hypothetical protein
LMLICDKCIEPEQPKPVPLRFGTRDATLPQ